MQNNLQRFHSTGVPCRGLSIAVTAKNIKLQFVEFGRMGAAVVYCL